MRRQVQRHVRDVRNRLDDLYNDVNQLRTDYVSIYAQLEALRRVNN